MRWRRRQPAWAWGSSAARALYARNGYNEIARYNGNPYAHHWFEKRLQRPRWERPLARRLARAGEA